ncbi:unnamed protein product [Arctia plantaginis]|uniref:Nephrocystin 3-like N-terminal domain-containing protein n=2 Tax=Arctia plantaginis TaxID=874455 RepID=A0A8S0ZGB1_ARCPL|nr:unnamed protein product [Arctia plantaginis]
MDQYKKRPGTSGISGQLYETKLISLILFRLLHNENVEDFLLASNMDEIGAFDDVCLKLKLKDHDRHFLVLIQAKHKENDAATLDDKNELAKWCESITKIREKYSCNKNKDLYFSGQFNDTDCLFIVYTNAKYDFGKTVPNRVFENSYANKLNDLISTGAVGLQPNYTDKDVEDYNLIILNEEMTVLAEYFEKYLHDNTSMNIMNNEYIIKYHVILKEKVVNVSEIQEKRGLRCRILSFQDDFFKPTEKYFVLFRKDLYKHVLKNRDKIKCKKTLNALISAFLTEPCGATLSPLIENHITYKNEKLTFLMKRPQSEIERLEQINISVETIYDTKAATAANILKSLALPVPIAFGNIDLAIRGTPSKIEQRLNHLTNFMVELLENAVQTEHYKVITIDDNIDEGLLNSNGGIGGGVGNILDYDMITKLFKFTSDYESLQNNAKYLYLNLKERFNNLDEYRFDVKTLKFPKLSLDYSNMAKDFLSRLLIYEKQSNHFEVEVKLKNEIKEFLISNPQSASVDSDTIFIHYHHVILNWWLSSTTESYLSKENNKFQLSINQIIKEPQMSSLQKTFYIHKIRNIDYCFTDDALQSLKSLNTLSRTVIITDITTLTTMKVIQLLRNREDSDLVIIDLEYVMTLMTIHFCKLIEELSKTKKLVIMVCNSKQDTERLTQLEQAIAKLKLIIITQKLLIETVNKYFLPTEIIYDEKQSLIDLTPDSKNVLIKTAEVIFQDETIDLELLIDDISVKFINRTVLSKIMRGETLNIGGSLSSFNYEEIKNVYINRKVSQTTVLDDNINPMYFKAHEDYFSIYSNEKYDDLERNVPLDTFIDIKDHAVLITAPPGMGKSTLLTHLSIKTKEFDKTLWIVRINLLEHSKQFYNWQVCETDMDSIETMKFICQIILKNHDLEISLKEIDNKMYLDDCTSDEWAAFVLNLFLHSYNNGKVIFLFDGFDEICPNYKDCVIKFFHIVKNYPQKNKMWVTSRPYCDILPDLKRIIGKSYGLEYINETEQEMYLKKIWKYKLKFDQFTNIQRHNAFSFINFMSENQLINNKTADSLQLKLREIYYLFNNYILLNMPPVDIDSPLYFDQYNSYNSFGITDKDSLNTNNETKYVYDAFGAARPIKVRLQDETLLRSPLLIYLIADYFVNLICNKTKSYQWDPYINVHKIYEMFIETKLKKILFEEKNKMDIYNPDIMDRFKQDLVDCRILHMKLAACLLFGSPVFSTESFEEFEKIDPLMQRGFAELDRMIDIIRAGKERTGLISHLTVDNLPVYIHATFTEYFAAEFMCEVFEAKVFEITDKILLYCALICSYSCEPILAWIYGKRKLNKNLDEIISHIESQLPFISHWYRELFYCDGWSRKQSIRLMASSEKDFESIDTFKYNEDYVEKLKALQPKERDMHIQKIRETIVPNMKPHLKKHFIKTDDAACSSTSLDI